MYDENLGDIRGLPMGENGLPRPPAVDEEPAKLTFLYEDFSIYGYTAAHQVGECQH